MTELELVKRGLQNIQVQESCIPLKIDHFPFLTLTSKFRIQVFHQPTFFSTLQDLNPVKEIIHPTHEHVI